MKNLLRKITIFITVLVFTFAASTSSIDAADYYKTDKQFTKEEFKVIKKQSLSIQKYYKFIENSKKDKAFEKKYGGAYLEEGDLIVNILDNVSKEDFKNTYGFDNEQQVKHVKNTYKTLLRGMEIASNSSFDEITSVKLDEKNNTIIVVHEGLMDSEIEALSTMIGVEGIIFEETFNDAVFTATYTVYNGTSLDFNNDSEGDLTVGFGAINNDTGERGVVTAGHIILSGFGNGDSVYYSGKLAGEIDGIHLGGMVDGAFVSLRDHWTRWDKFYNTNDYRIDGVGYGFYTEVTCYSSSYLQGTTIYGYFNVSGKQQGTITSPMVTLTTQGVTLTSLIETDAQAVRGDSGGSLVYYEYYPNSSIFKQILLSVQSSSTNLEDDGHTWTEDSYSYSTRADYIMGTLDLSLYTE